MQPILGNNAPDRPNEIFGDGVTVSGATYTGANNFSTIDTNGQLSPGGVPSGEDPESINSACNDVVGGINGTHGSISFETGV